jgi:hypothetical protein
MNMQSLYVYIARVLDFLVFLLPPSLLVCLDYLSNHTANTHTPLFCIQLSPVVFLEAC